jgi:hypothetical protein
MILCVLCASVVRFPGDFPSTMPANDRLRERELVMGARIGSVGQHAARCCIGVTVMAAIAGRAVAQAPDSWGGFRTEIHSIHSIQVSPENTRFNDYLRDLTRPSTVIGVVGGGLLTHFRSKSNEWTEGTDGLARQIASNAGQVVVEMSVRHGLAAAMNRSTDTRYHPCDCHGFGPRVAHAFVETFTDRRADGSRAFSIPQVAGAYAGNFAQAAWEPGHSASAVAMGTTVSLGLSALFNVGRELTGLGH